MEHDELWQRLSERLDSLEAENEQLRAHLALSESVEDDDPSPVSRRAWLARGAAVAVGAVAGGVALGARPAAAANGDHLTVGGTFAGTATTNLTSDVPAPNDNDALLAALNVTNSNATRGTGVFGSGSSFGVVGLAEAGTGVLGYGFGAAGQPATGVVGQIMDSGSAGSVGVFGDASGAGQIGVKATSTAGTALRAESTSGSAVVGVSSSGTGVEGASSTKWGGWFHSGREDLLLGNSNRPSPALDLVAHDYGSLVAQNSSDAATSTLWMCVRSGRPGTWRRVVGADTAGALSLLPAAIRVHDTRPGTAAALGAKVPLATGVDRVIACTAAASGVPADATGVLLSVTVGAVAAGSLSVRANGAAYLGHVNLSFAAGQTVTTSVTSACAAGAKIALRLAVAATCNVMVDVVGYYR